MREYAYKEMAELAGELGAGLLRLRKGYVDAAETLGRIIDPGREYPYDFVVYRLTGYRPPAAEGDSQPIIGGTSLSYSICHCACNLRTDGSIFV